MVDSDHKTNVENISGSIGCYYKLKNWNCKGKKKEQERTDEEFKD